MAKIVSSTKTYCRICEAACGLVVDFDDLGDAVRIRPDKDNPNSKGFACSKGTRFLETNRSGERLQYPMARQADGTLKRISWREAYKRMRTHIKPIVDSDGPHALGYYFGNPLAFNAGAAAASFGLLQSLGTRNVYAAGSQDCNNKFTGGYIVHGSPLIHPLPDFEHAELAILLGTNPAVSQSSFVHLDGGSTVFDRMKARGARIVVVDPRRSESAKRFGEHIAIRPGTDLFLLFAILNDMPERADGGVSEGLAELRHIARSYTAERAADITGVPADTIRALAKDIADKRTAMHMSVGVNQGPFGTLAYVALQAVLYASGNLDRDGGSLFHPLAVMAAKRAPHGGYGSLDKRSRIGGFPAVLDSLPGGILAEEIMRPGPERIRAMICIAGDPLRSIPGSAALAEAFKQLDYLVVIDTFKSRASEAAHLVLPATTWLERFDVATTTTFFQFAPRLQYAAPVLRPPGEAKDDGRILADISIALGKPIFGSNLAARAFGMALKTSGARLAAAAAFVKRFGVTLEAGSFKVPVPTAGSYIGKGPVTPGHKLRFWHPWLEGEIGRIEQWLAADVARRTRGGYTLICRRRRLGHNSWLRGATRSGDPERVAWLNGADYEALGLNGKGGEIDIVSVAGRLRIPAQVNDDVGVGTVVVPHGLHDADVNAIIPSGSVGGYLEPLSGQHVMTGIAVEIAAA